MLNAFRMRFHIRSKGNVAVFVLHSFSTIILILGILFKCIEGRASSV